MQIRNHLSRILGEKRISISALSKETGISRTTLTRLYHCAEKSVSYDMLRITMHN